MTTLAKSNLKFSYNKAGWRKYFSEYEDNELKELVAVRFTPNQVQLIDNAVDDGPYSDRSDLIRNAVKNEIKGGAE